MTQRLTLKDAVNYAKSKDGVCLSKEYKNNRSKLTWRCSTLHIWKASFSNIKAGHWCPNCVGLLKHTIEYCKEVAIKKNGTCLSKKYKNNGTPMLWKCGVHHTWTARFGDILNNTWCPKCAGKAKHTIKHCQRIANNRNGTLVSKEYKNIDTIMVWRCKFGHEWKATLNNIQQNKWCPNCAGVAKFDLNFCDKTASSKNGKCISQKYFNAITPIRWKCHLGHIWKASLNSVKNNDTWCPSCAGVKKYDINICKKIAKERGGRCLSLHYINSISHLKWGCSKGHEWVATLNNIKNNKQWCPGCKSKKTQKILEECIRQIFPTLKIKPNFKEFGWLYNPKTNGKQEIDIWVPQVKLAIEYDGEQHFWPVRFGGSKEEAEQRFEQTKIRDKRKNKLIKQNPEDVFYFVRFNYKEKNKLTKEYVLNKLVKNNVPIQQAML